MQKHLETCDVERTRPLEDAELPSPPKKQLTVQNAWRRNALMDKDTQATSSSTTVALRSGPVEVIPDFSPLREPKPQGYRRLLRKRPLSALPPIPPPDDELGAGATAEGEEQNEDHDDVDDEPPEPKSVEDVGQAPKKKKKVMKKSR